MIRVLRLIEYTFEDNEQAEKHMSRFGMPANGTKTITDAEEKQFTIRSAIITDFSNSAIPSTPQEQTI